MAAQPGEPAAAGGGRDRLLSEKEKLSLEAAGEERALAPTRSRGPVLPGTPWSELVLRGLAMAILGGWGAVAILPTGSAGELAFPVVWVALGLSLGLVDALRRRLPPGTRLQDLVGAARRRGPAFWSLHLAGFSAGAGVLLLLPWALARPLGVLGRDWISIVPEWALVGFLTAAIVSSLLVIGWLPELLTLPLLAALDEAPEDQDAPPRLVG